MNHRWLARIFFIVTVAFIASILIWRFGWQSVFPTIYIALASIMLLFGRYRAFLPAVGVLILLGFILPAIDPARPAIRRMNCSDNLKKIASAIRQYESSNGFLPPPSVLSDDGVPLFGWRVLILPYIGEKELFEKLDLTKPWNDPVNLKIGEQMPIVFRCPESRRQSRWRTIGTMTSYVAVVGLQTAWPTTEMRKADEFDPDSRNILVVESVKHQTHWMAPGDPTIEIFLSSPEFNEPHDGLVNFVEFDGETHVLSDNVPTEKIQKLLTIQRRNAR